MLKNDFNTQKLRNAFADYFANGIKKLNSGTLGLELEHFVVDSGSLCSIPYSGENSVEKILNEILTFYEETTYSNEHLIGLKRSKCLITLEPAAQIETSIGEFERIKEFEEEYSKFTNEITPILNSMNARLINLGYLPRDFASRLELIPKERYKLMNSFFKTTGSLGTNMMRGTASTQASIDYYSENDFIKKFFLASVLTPFFAFLFDNSPIFEGRMAKSLSRVEVWESVDSSRCGFLDCAFDRTGFLGYADYILSSMPIFLVNNNGKSIATGRKTVKQLFCDGNISKQEIEHVLSMVFPYVRVKSYIEIRMPDSLPIKYALGFLALIKGIFYNEKALNQLYEELNSISLINTHNAFNSIKNDRKIFSYSYFDFFDKLYDLAFEALDAEEQQYLSILISLKNLSRPLDLEGILEMNKHE